MSLVGYHSGISIFYDSNLKKFYFITGDGSPRTNVSLDLLKNDIDFYLGSSETGVEPPGGYQPEPEPEINYGEPDYIDYQYNGVDVWYSPDVNNWYAIDIDGQKWAFQSTVALEQYLNANIDNFKDVYNLGEEGYFVKYFYVGSAKYDIYYNNVKGYYCPSKKDNYGVPWYFNTLIELENYLKGLVSPFPSEVKPVVDITDDIVSVFDKILSFWTHNLINNPASILLTNALNFVGITLKGFTGSSEDYEKAISLVDLLQEDIANGIASLIFSRAVFGSVNKQWNPQTSTWGTRVGGLNTDFGTQLAVFRTLNNIYFGLTNMVQQFNQSDYGQTDVTDEAITIVRPHIEGYWSYSKSGGPYGSGWLRSKYGPYYVRKNIR